MSFLSSIPRVAALSGALFLCMCVGCGDSPSPETQAYRETVLLSEEPDGAVSIEQARAEIETTTDLVLMVKVGNKDVPQWWDEEQAALVVSEGIPGSDYNITDDHDPSTCPFCKYKWKTEDSMASIRFVGEDGEVIPMDARPLLDVEQGDILVVRGRGSLGPTGLLEVQSDGVFVKGPQ